MSFQKIQSAFKAMNNCEAWSLQLLRIKNSKRKKTEYAAFSVKLTPQGELTSIVKEISDHFMDSDNGQFKSFVRVQDYDGTTEGNVIYKLNSQDSLIKEEYDALINALANTEQEADPLSQKLQAYVIQGDIEIKGEKTGLKLISIQNPVTTLKHKFLHEKNTFREIKSKVLSLRSVIDVMILDGEIYFFSMAGEKLFNMERAYKTVCDQKVIMLEESGMLYDSDIFGSVATSGHHPRMFVSFNKERYRKLKDEKSREKFAKLFSIPMKEGKLDTSNADAADKLVRVLCDKGMYDPFDNLPVEVSGARKWQ